VELNTRPAKVGEGRQTEKSQAAEAARKSIPMSSSEGVLIREGRGEGDRRSRAHIWEEA